VSPAVPEALASVRVGLRFTEAVQAATMAAAGCSREEVVEKLTAGLAAPDVDHARRVAGTISRRVLCDAEADEDEVLCPLSTVVAAAGRRIDARHLLLYATARHEPLVMAVASELFYRRFVLGEALAEMSDREYATFNTGKLFETDDVVTHRLVNEYARRRWHLDDPSSIQCALRILREGGALGATWISRDETRCLGYFPTHRGPSWRVFVYALLEEFAARGRRSVPRAHLRTMAMARVFCLRGPAVDVLAGEAAEHGFCTIRRTRSGGPVTVAQSSFAEAALRLAAWLDAR